MADDARTPIEAISDEDIEMLKVLQSGTQLMEMVLTPLIRLRQLADVLLDRHLKAAYQVGERDQIDVEKGRVRRNVLPPAFEAEEEATPSVPEPLPFEPFKTDVG